MHKTFNGFESLDVYKSSRAFRIKISQLVKHFPSDEKYLLRSQIIRSSRSIAANIAEGYGRFYYKEFIQFCRQGRGSLTETLEHLICAFDEGYINEQQLNLIKVDY
ncbi:MAG: four helix bundle protein [Flavisolibacter sp.]